MTTTESAPTTRRNGRQRHDGDGAALTDQVVLSGAGLASQGIGGIRRTVDGTIAAMDAVVTGAFDLADQMIVSNLMVELAAKTIATARSSWSIGIETTRSALIDL